MWVEQDDDEVGLGGEWKIPQQQEVSRAYFHRDQVGCFLCSCCFLFQD